METSTTITAISKALLSAQKEMGNALKDATNPFFKSKYADLNSIREASMPALNKHGITVLQPTVHQDGKNFIQTILLHESGEFMASLTEIIYNKINDAQAQGSGITYARRYGLQSFVNVGAEDDDGNKASLPEQKAVKTKPYLNESSTEFEKAVVFLKGGGLITKIDEKYNLSATVRESLLTAAA